jgi:hypothetical protein
MPGSHATRSRGDPNREIGILQMADNAAARNPVPTATSASHETTRAWDHCDHWLIPNTVTRREDMTRKYRAALGYAIIFSALPDIPATSQLDWLISTTAMIVLSWSRATRDLLKSFGWASGHSIS